MIANTQSSFDFDRVTFDAEIGKGRKEDGLAQAALSRQDLLELAHTYAIAIARRYGLVTFDDVFAAMQRDGLHPEELGNAAGSVFRTDFIFTGEWRKSERVSNHARVNRVWRLKDSLELPAKKPVASVGFEVEATGVKEECI